MIEHKTLAQEMEDIFNRLKELDKLDFPKYRTYKRPDGTWVCLLYTSPSPRDS